MATDLTPRQKEIYKSFVECGHSLAKTSQKTGVSVPGLRQGLFYCAAKGYPLIATNSKPTAWAVNKDGEKVIEWHRANNNNDTEEKILSILKNRTPVAPKIPRLIGRYDPNTMIEWKLMDAHLGMHAWAKETGENYDIKIAKQIIINAAKKIYGDTGNINTTVIVLGGDNIHADNSSELTERGRNKLDVDGRYDKSIDGIVTSMITAIDIAAKVSKNVVVIVLSGNHDRHSSKWLAHLLKWHYYKSKQIFVNTSPMLHKFYRWGVSYFMYTHGHKGTDQRLATFLLNKIIQENLTGIKYKLIRKGHLHKEGSKYPDGLNEVDGVKIETYSSIAAHDSYAGEEAYQSQRATITTRFHKKFGDQGSRPYKVEELI